MAPWTAALVAACKLLLWHLAQPAAYALIVLALWAQLGRALRVMCALLMVREGWYALVALLYGRAVEMASVFVQFTLSSECGDGGRGRKGGRVRRRGVCSVSMCCMAPWPRRLRAGKAVPSCVETGDNDK
jgi:uncharacterized membrane protein YgcG